MSLVGIVDIAGNIFELQLTVSAVSTVALSALGRVAPAVSVGNIGNVDSLSRYVNKVRSRHFWQYRQ